MDRHRGDQLAEMYCQRHIPSFEHSNCVLHPLLDITLCISRRICHPVWRMTINAPYKTVTTGRKASKIDRQYYYQMTLLQNNYLKVLLLPSSLYYIPMFFKFG